MKPKMAKQFMALEKENTRLKKMIAEQALDMEILKAVHWIIKPLPRMRPVVFFRLRLRLRLQNTAELPTPILSLNLVQRPGGIQYQEI